MADAKTADSPADIHAHEHVVHEAVGPAISPLQAASAIGVGVNSLLVLGVLPALLGALADEHRLTDSQIGLSAMLELLAMGISTGLCGLVGRPRRLRLIGAAASLGLAAVDLAGVSAHGDFLLALRAAA